MALRESRGRLLALVASSYPLKKVEWEEQKGNKWCWTACAAMILNGMSVAWSQCEIAGKILCGDCSSAKGVVPCNRRGKALAPCDVEFPIEKIENLWSELGIEVVPVNSALSWDDALVAFKDGPVQVFLCADRSSSGHLILLTGTDPDSALSRRWVLAADPASDRRDVSPISFDALLAGKIGPGKWRCSWKVLGPKKRGGQ